MWLCDNFVSKIDAVNQGYISIMETLRFKSELTAAAFPELPFIMIKNIEGFICNNAAVHF